MNWDLLTTLGLVVLLPTTAQPLLSWRTPFPKLTSALLTLGSVVIAAGLIGLGAYKSAGLEVTFAVLWGTILVRDVTRAVSE